MRRLVHGVLAVAGGSALAMTLAACYGAPCASGDGCDDDGGGGYGGQSEGGGGAGGQGEGGQGGQGP
jgi:hypothetical protein